MTISKPQGLKHKWPFNSQTASFKKKNRSSSSTRQAKETNAPAITAPAITVLGSSLPRKTHAILQL